MKVLSRYDVPSKLIKVDSMQYTQSGKVARNKMRTAYVKETLNDEPTGHYMGETYTFGKYGGKLKHLEPETLLMPLFEEMNSIFPKIIPDIDDVVIGNIVGNGGNIARKALLEAGLAESIPGVTMDRQCGSGLESIIYACRMVQAGAGHIYIAGGVESTSRAPWKIKRPQSVYDTQLPEFYERASFAPKGQDPSMIEAAENVAQYYHITRKQQDAFAIRSHHLTHQYYKNGSISNEIVSLNIKGHLFDKDESIKPTLTEQRLNRLRPLLANGTVTVGNSCMKMTALRLHSL